MTIRKLLKNYCRPKWQCKCTVRCNIAKERNFVKDDSVWLDLNGLSKAVAVAMSNDLKKQMANQTFEEGSIN